jgi:hypothetical protein
MKKFAALALLICWTVAQAGAIQHEYGAEHNQQLGTHICISQAIDDDELVIVTSNCQSVVELCFSVQAEKAIDYPSLTLPSQLARGPPSSSSI